MVSSLLKESLEKFFFFSHCRNDLLPNILPSAFLHKNLVIDIVAQCIDLISESCSIKFMWISLLIYIQLY